MYRRILVPIDGSDASLSGLEHALALATDQKARVRFLNVVDETVLTMLMAEPVAMPVDDVLESMRVAGRKVLDEALARAQRAGVDAEAAQMANRGKNVSDAILAEARRWRADVIVMGTHGRRGLNRLLLGSDAERVLRDAPVPVLLTRRTGRQPARRRARSPANPGRVSAV
jgi:nucleotide-binding universal stress UspA family protein